MDHLRSRTTFYPLTSLRLFWLVFLLAPLVLLACSSGGLLPVGKGAKGETLRISIEEINRVQEIRYQGNDLNHYLVVPSSKDNELVVMRLIVHNSEATRVLMTVDEQAAEVRGFGPDEKYRPLDLTLQNEKNVKVAEGSHPSENLFVPFIAGSVELPQGYSVVGWIVFEVPNGTRLREMRWEAGDIVYIRS